MHDSGHSGRCRGRSLAARRPPGSAACNPESCRYTFLRFNGPLAQLAEQGTLNPKVRGSIPRRPTMSFTRAGSGNGAGFSVHRTRCPPAGAGACSDQNANPKSQGRLSLAPDSPGPSSKTPRLRTRRRWAKRRVHVRVSPSCADSQATTTVKIAPPASGIATHTLYFWSADRAGNTETQKSKTFTIQP